MIHLAAAFLLALQSAGQTATWQFDAGSPICDVQQEGALGKIKVSRTPANEETKLEITIPQRPNDRDKRFDGSIEISPAGTSPASGFLSKREKKLKVYVITQDPTFIQDCSNASGLIISSRSIEPVQIAVQSAAFAVGALRDCEDVKMRGWGIDPVAWRSLKSRPIPIGDPRERFSSLDYPEEALRAHVEFDAIIRLDVGTDGRVERCRELNPSSYNGFEMASCAVLNKGRFHPALDSAGRPVSAPIVYDVIFRIGS